MADNTITIVGNLTRDPDLRYTTSGRGVTTLGVAVSRRFQRNGEWDEETSFLNVVAWGDLGENAAASLSKGARVIVTGDLRQRTYTTKDGEERSVVEINATGLGPDLRWATAQVERIARETATRAPQRPAGGRVDGEEPF